MDYKMFFNHPIRYALAVAQQKGFLSKLNDKAYCSLVMFSRTGVWPNYKQPKRFNEKMQWLKIYYRRPELTKLVDKCTSREVVADLVGDKYVIPIIGRWDNADKIDLDNLPGQFVLKCNHDGGVIVCRDKSHFNLAEAKAKLTARMKVNYYDHAREWPYKNIPPCIFAEPLISDGDKENLPVYKFLCFSGEPKIIQTIQNDKTSYETIDYFDLDWNLLKLNQNYSNSEHPFERPELLSEMISVARKLCQGYPFIRIDLYQADGKVLFSEFTLFSDAGFEAFHPDDWDKKLGDWITLPEPYME